MNKGQQEFAGDIDDLITVNPDGRAIRDICFERLGQQTEFPLAEDDALLPAEWVARIAKHLGRSVSTNPDVFRQELVVVGALALAAVESFDRKFHGEPGE